MLASMVCLFLLTACHKELPALSSKFDPVKVEEKTKSVIALVNARDGQAMREMGTEEIKESLTDEAMQPVYEKKSFIVTITFTPDMKLSGLFFK